MQIKDYIRTERFMGTINTKIIELLPMCPAHVRKELVKKIYYEVTQKNVLVAPESVILRQAAAFARHRNTDYHRVMSYNSREDSRRIVYADVNAIIEEWRGFLCLTP